MFFSFWTRTSGAGCLAAVPMLLMTLALAAFGVFLVAVGLMTIFR